MEYNFDKVQDAGFCCVHCFLNCVMAEFEDLNPNSFQTITIAVKEDLAQEIFRELSEAKCECGEHIFNYGYVHYTNFDYKGEYLISLSNSDNELFIEQMITDKGDYLYADGEITFIHEDCNYRAIERLNSGYNNIVIFGFDE